MQVILVHHAHAVGPGDDARRSLSPRGHTQAEALAARASTAGCRPDTIWHSGKLRARQTAEAFLRACNPSADFRMVRGLHPGDPPEWMRDELVAEPRAVMVVGHMPQIAALARVMSPDSEPFPLHGLIALERNERGQLAESWRAEPPDVV